MIVIVFGLPGSGKSFFASRLALEINGTYVNSDQVRIQLFKHRHYTEEEKEQVYDKMLEMAQEASTKNENMVIDATFYQEQLREPYLSFPIQNAVYFIEVQASDNLIRQRLAKPRAFSEADYKVYKKIKNEWESFRGNHLVLESTDVNIEEMIKKTKLYLNLIL